MLDFTFKDLGTSVSILGGYQKDYADAKTDAMVKDKASDITINSGKFIVVGASRQIALPTGRYTGGVNLTINGGEIVKTYAGCVNDGLNLGPINITITGGKITTKMFTHNSSTDHSYNEGDVTITVKGGDFSECKGIVGAAGTNNVLDLR